MADKKTYTGLSKNYATVPAFSITTIDYLDTKPNYFRVQNRGTTEIYCSTNNMPTTKHYDFAVAGKKMKMFAEPYNRTRLYIFNPSGSDVEVAVLSFQAEFEPLTLALSEIEVEMPDVIEATTAISSFQAPLPAGNNKIGKVEITNAPAAEDVTSIKNDVKTSLVSWEKLMSNTEESGVITLLTILKAISTMISFDYTSNVAIFSGEGKSTETTLYQDVSSKYCLVHMLTNDGSGDMSLVIKGRDMRDAMVIDLKSGETITDLKVNCTYLAVTGTNYSFRAMVTIKDENV